MQEHSLAVKRRKQNNYITNKFYSFYSFISSVVDPDPYVFGLYLRDKEPSLFVRIPIRILQSSSKNSNKNLPLCCFV